MIQPRLNTFFLVALIAGALLACGSLVPISSPPATSESSQPEAATLEATPTASPQPIAPQPTAADIAAFPGAEGFGAIATGGRGGRVIYVTTLDADPNGEVEGSLNWALRQEGPRYILFKVSGVINGPAYIRRGDVTIAGQTSPGGIITRGLICDDHYEDNDCRNLVIRHIRSRPALQIDNQEGVLDDALRLDGVDTAIIDYGQSKDFIVHRVANEANVPGLENIANLEDLPELGAWIIALPIKIAGGSGGPLRIVALIPR